MSVVAILVVVLVIPVLLVWPRASAQVIPRPWRREIVAHPGRWSALLAVPLTVLVCLGTAPLVLGAAAEGRSASHQAVSVALICGLFGGLTAAAVIRAVRIGSMRWAASAAASPLALTWPLLSRPESPPTARMKSVADMRPLEHRPDRQLRNAASWLGAIGLGWYLLGRGVQLTHNQSGAPGWWWTVTVVLLAAGGAVCVSRRARWRSAGRRSSASSDRELEPLLTRYGFAIHRPAGGWVRQCAPAAFMSDRELVGDAVWSWAGTGSMSGAAVLVAAQRGQTRNRTGLTAGRTRMACVVQTPGRTLPFVCVAEREAVPPRERNKSIPLELEDFNRALWAWGPDPRGVYDVLHPRAMAHVIRNLPDGARLVTAGDYVAVTTDEPVSATLLDQVIAFTMDLAQLTPTYLGSASR